VVIVVYVTIFRCVLNVEACRGNQLDFGVDVTDGPGNYPSLCMKRVASEADFLFSYSTAPGHCFQCYSEHFTHIFYA